MPGRISLALALALVAGAGAACSSDDPGRAVVDPAGAAVTEFADLEPASRDVTLPGLDTASPAPGSVGQVVGPFDDRFTLTRLAVSDGVVTGRLRVTSDVSELLELEVVAGFYDRDGRFLGTGRAVHHLDEGAGHANEEGPPSETELFEITAAPRFADRVSAAVVGVPVLVNE